MKKENTQKLFIYILEKIKVYFSHIFILTPFYEKREKERVKKSNLIKLLHIIIFPYYYFYTFLKLKVICKHKSYFIYSKK